MRYIEGINRKSKIAFPEYIDDYKRRRDVSLVFIMTNMQEKLFTSK